jgi:hypothetical protein
LKYTIQELHDLKVGMKTFSFILLAIPGKKSHLNYCFDEKLIKDFALELIFLK